MTRDVKVLTTPAEEEDVEEEQLEPLHKLLESSAAPARVTTRSSSHSIDITNQNPRSSSISFPGVTMWLCHSEYI